jgi:endo-1,4-beta-xylanase
MRNVRTVACVLAIGFLTYATVSAEPKKPAGKPLRELAAKRNLLIGAAADPWLLEHAELSKILAREFNSIVAENAMKCGGISRGRNEYNFKPADQVIAFAEQHKMKVRGHTLIWYKSVPGWLTKETWTRETMLAWLKEYITTVVSHFKGKVYCWDVVNEAFEGNGKYLHELKSIWQKVCGPDYIDNAFIWAHEADPDAKLYMNDVSCEFTNRQSTAMYEWAKSALARGVPVHGIGFQAHMTENPKLDFSGIRVNLKRFKELGLELQFTEVDIRIDAPATPEKLASQAAMYKQFMDIALEFSMPAFTTWGVSDEDSWVPQHFPGSGDALLFDKRYQPKPAYAALQEALASPPPAKTKK